MGKKKREHIVFDKMLVQKKTVPFNKVNVDTQRITKKRITSHIDIGTAEYNNSFPIVKQN